MSTASSVFLGVDVAKAELVWARRPSEASGTVPNDEAGIARLVEAVQRLAPALVVLEATGGHERALVAASQPPQPATGVHRLPPALQRGTAP